ncbi:Aste57867_15470 [Aphanomyces stellatus]|uniref:CST complex subunit CTC1 n=1 Tax=Aphanomyces stellatus TaxID=120398 RepID=A0A485L377_9STRA|nr:hypothetical protein As57867_015414 [Aphanomyces stellatus]VFT92272.1 Aste57867_15470 [Aphanomyces stellatus]
MNSASRASAMAPPIELESLVARLGQSPAEKASIHENLNKGALINRVVLLRDLTTAPPDTVRRAETSGCCGSDVPVCTCVHAKEPPQCILSPHEGETAAVVVGRLEYCANSSVRRARWHGLYLCDGDTALPVVLLRPNPRYLDQVVSISEWTCILMGPAAAYLEVKSIHMELTTAPSILSGGNTWGDVLTLYPNHEPPVYGGAYHLARALRHSRKETTKSRSYIVMGRVAAISPIAVHQMDTHFFVEVDAVVSSERNNPSRQSIFIIASGRAVRLHPFLWPGAVVVLTDLVKVFAKECNVYILHTTCATLDPRSARTTLHHLDVAAYAAITATAPLPPFVFGVPVGGGGAMVHLDGQITRRISDDSFELDRTKIVLFAHFPLANQCAGLRIGARLSLFHVHVLGPTLVGLCARSAVVLDAFADAHSPMLLQPLHSRVHELAFHQLSLPHVAYLLDLSQAIFRRFGTRPAHGADPNEGESSQEAGCSAWQVDFRHVKKQTLLRAIAESAGGIHWRTRPTLGKSFLVHEPCFSAPPPDADQAATKSAISLQELVDYFMAKPSTPTPGQSLFSSTDEGHPRFLVLGCLAGSIASNDLCLVDRTASIPLAVLAHDGRDDDDPLLTASPSLYHLLSYDVVVTTLPAPPPSDTVASSLARSPGIVVSPTVVRSLHLRCRLAHLRPLPSPHLDRRADVAVRRFVVVRIDSIQSTRVVHAIQVPRRDDDDASHPFHDDDDENAWTVAQLVVPEAFPWYLQAHSVWDVGGLRARNTLRFDPPMVAPYAFMYNLAKFKRGLPAHTTWPPLNDVAHDADTPLVMLRYAADQDTTFDVVDGLGLPIPVSPRRAPCIDSDRHLFTNLAHAFDQLTSPDTLHVIPLRLKKSPPTCLADGDVPPDTHHDRLVSIAGVVAGLAWTPSSTHEDTVKPRKQSSRMAPAAPPLLLVTVRARATPDTVVVGLCVATFGWPSGLAVGVHVVLHRVQLHVRQQSYKLHCVQTHATHVHVVVPPSPLRLALPPVAYLIDMYQYEVIDRRVHRFLASVCHVSYVILKCVCRGCHSVLHREVPTNALRHGQFHYCDQPTTDPRVTCALRCILDDGTAQVELYCQDDVAWDLLQMPMATRARFELDVKRQGGELTYFASNDSVPTPLQESWRDAVAAAIAATGQQCIFARRFYTKEKGDGQQPMSMLRCGDFAVRTSVQSMVHMEGTAVESVSVAAEVRRLM